MTTFADSMKREIARVARKELKEDITSLRKSAAMHRGEIAGLKKQVQALQGEVRKLAKELLSNKKSRSSTAESQIVSEARGRPGRKVVFTPERMKAQRTRLGLTQEQMAKLLGVSSLSVWKWESGATAPRASRVPQLLHRLSLGKREARAILDESSS